MSRVRVLVTCLLCSLMALAVWPASATAKGGAGPTAGIIPIYQVKPLHARVLVPLDPATLAEESQGGITLGLTPLGRTFDFAGSLPQVIVSPNGAMMAVMSGCSGCQGPSANYSRVRIVTNTGRQLAAWRPLKSMYLQYVSDDGKQVAGFAVKPTSLGPWLVVNARTGKIMHRVSGLNGSFDPALNRFYLGNTVGGTYTMTAYDAGTGSVISNLPLPGLAAQQTQEPMVNGRAIIDDTWPAFAVSPDGQRIAVVDGANETLTMIDAPHLRVLSTQSIRQPESWVQRFGQFLGVIPSVAEAKGPVRGTRLSATFSRDGRSLYVSGETDTPAPTGVDTIRTYLPLRRIDPATGEVLAQQDEDGYAWIVGQSFDGGALFVETYTAYGETDVREYDASTLQLLAHRTFMEDPNLVLLRPAGG